MRKQMKGGLKNMQNVNLKVMTIFAMSLLIFGAIAPLVQAIPLSQENRVALERYKQSKEDFLKARGEYTQARQDFMTARQKFGNRDQATLEAARNFIMKANVATVSHLENFRAFVESDFALSESDKNAITSAIDSDITWLQNKQSEIESADRDTLIQIGKDTQNYWQSVRVDLKKYTGQILNARAQWLLDEAGVAREKVQGAIDQAQLAGKNTQKAEAVLADFDEKFALAQAEYDKAKNSFNSIDDLSSADKFFREANQFFMKGNVYLRQSYQSLRDAYSSIRQ